MHERVFIGIGSNLAPRHATIHAGVRDLDRHPQVSVLRLSTLIETDPVGPEGQGPYLNGACELRTSLEPRALLGVMLEIERTHGRDRSKEQRWGPRTLDLDLLRFGDRSISEEGLVVPHPRMCERRFVLRPLLELAPDLTLSVPGDQRDQRDQAVTGGGSRSRLICSVLARLK